VVRHSVCISKESYSLKSIEAFYMQAREEKIADGAASIVAYERYIATRDEALLGAIAGYNERDCESTRLLRDWLEARRGEMTAQAGRALLHSGPAEGAPSAAPIEGIEVGSALVSVA
jgi:hypothetical protein